MKKIFLRIAAVIVLLLVFIGCFLQWRQSVSYKNRIHNKANLIIKVNVDAIAQTLVADCIGSPAFYLHHKKATTKDTSDHGKGISVPANIFLYTIQGKSSGTFFCSVPVKDSTLAKAFIKKKLGIDSFYTVNSISFGSSANHKITVAYNEETIAAAFSMTQENVADVLTDLVLGKHMLSSSDTVIGKLKAAKDHIVLMDNKNTGAINFIDGQVVLNAVINTGSILHVDDAPSHRVLSKDGCAMGWLDAQFLTDTADQIFHIKEYAFSRDSLLKHYKGYMDFELGNKEIEQTDSVITYGYNDNFEKVAEVAVVKNKTPAINISFRSNAGDLYNYLQTADAVKPGNTINRDIVPLYAFYATPGTAFMSFSTDKEARFNEAVVGSSEFFYLLADIEKIVSSKQFPLLNNYIKNGKRLELKAKKNGDDKAVLDGHLQVFRAGINALTQLDE